MFNLINGLFVALFLVIGCSVDDRLDRSDDSRRLLTDPEDLNNFPVDEQRRLREEYNSLPQSMMVRIPTNGEGRLVPQQAEARYFDRRVNFDDNQVPMHLRWSQGRDSSRIAFAHNTGHAIDEERYRKRGHHHGNRWIYRHYTTPYYRSVYNRNYWWNSYSFYRSYPANGYQYCVYYPRGYRSSYRYFPKRYFRYGYY